MRLLWRLRGRGMIKPIESGWQSYRHMVLPADAPEVQVKECQQAFYAGAAILFQGLMTALDPGNEPTDRDMLRMANIQAELDEFGQQLDRRYFGKKEH